VSGELPFMTAPIIAPYAAVLGLLFAALSARTLLLRRRLRVALGDGGNEQLLRAARAHANFAEYAPLVLLLLLLAEQVGLPAPLLHALAVALVLGRALHAFGVSRVPERPPYRVAGMALTLTPLGVVSLYLALMAL
jgi:uncharacterized membrane protein YecN with MAPEG domain